MRVTLPDYYAKYNLFKMYSQIDLFSFGVARVASQHCFHELYIFALVVNVLYLFDNILHGFDNIWYMLTMFGTLLYQSCATAFALGLPFPTHGAHDGLSWNALEGPIGALGANLGPGRRLEFKTRLWLG